MTEWQVERWSGEEERAHRPGGNAGEALLGRWCSRARRVVVCMVLGTLLPGSALGQNAVTAWDEISAAAVQADRPPAGAEYLHALVHLAVWDAVTSLSGSGAPYLARVQVQRPASLEAAIAGAAHRVLVTRVPGRTSEVEDALRSFLRTIPDGPAKEKGLAVGRAAATALLASRADDGFERTVDFVQPARGPGVFEPVASAVPLDIKLARVRPLLPRRADQFRPRGPQPLTSVEYASDFQEVKLLGRSDGSGRTPEQTETARFWSENPFVQVARNLRELTVARRMDAVATSQLLTRAHLAAAEAILAGWEAKYHFLFWRPIHAIQRADSDGNAGTERAAEWTALLTVNHPEYPSAHAFFTSAVTRAVRRVLGTDQVSWTVSSNVTHTSRTFRSLQDLRTEVGNARVWGGLHFRHSIHDGDQLGLEVEDFAARFLGSKDASRAGDLDGAAKQANSVVPR